MLMSVERQAAPAASDGAWLLLAELNHRIGNELQAALSALRCAKRGLGSAGVHSRFVEEAMDRLENVGDVHRLLDRQRGHGPVAERLEALCRAVSLSKAAPAGIHVSLELGDVVVDEEAAWTLCVVASELMTNACRHAFPNGRPGAIGVSLQREHEAVVLTVADNGVGLQGSHLSAVWQPGGFGSGIVEQLAHRIGGAVDRIDGPRGVSVSLTVPAAARTQRARPLEALRRSGDD